MFFPALTTIFSQLYVLLKTFYVMSMEQRTIVVYTYNEGKILLWFHYENTIIQIQSTLVISNSKGLSEILRDICTSRYQVWSIEEKWIEQPHFTNVYVIWFLEIEIYWKYCGREEKLSVSPLFHNILLPIVRLSCLNRDQIFTSSVSGNSR